MPALAPATPIVKSDEQLVIAITYAGHGDHRSIHVMGFTDGTECVA